MDLVARAAGRRAPRAAAVFLDAVERLAVFVLERLDAVFVLDRLDAVFERLEEVLERLAEVFLERLEVFVLERPVVVFALLRLAAVFFERPPVVFALLRLAAVFVFDLLLPALLLFALPLRFACVRLLATGTSRLRRESISLRVPSRGTRETRRSASGRMDG